MSHRSPITNHHRWKYLWSPEFNQFNHLQNSKQDRIYIYNDAYQSHVINLWLHFRAVAEFSRTYHLWYIITAMKKRVRKLHFSDFFLCISLIALIFSQVNISSNLVDFVVDFVNFGLPSFKNSDGTRQSTYILHELPPIGDNSFPTDGNSPSSPTKDINRDYKSQSSLLQKEAPSTSLCKLTAGPPNERILTTHLFRRIDLQAVDEPQ